MHYTSYTCTILTSSSIFALIIGVDEVLSNFFKKTTSLWLTCQYLSEDIPNLAGAVNDAQDMEDLLINDFKVPRTNVLFLHNETATRQNILDSIQAHLLQNANIQRGDSMIIFFAGHGSRVLSPQEWFSSDGKIEVICPYDEETQDGNGETIPAIPDRTINNLTRRLAETKGNNIVSLTMPFITNWL